MNSLLKKIPDELLQYFSDEGEKLPSSCLICGNRPFFIGHIEKSNPKQMLIYCLCWECCENPESNIIVEKIIDYYETIRKDNSIRSAYYGECWSLINDSVIQLIIFGDGFKKFGFHSIADKNGAIHNGAIHAKNDPININSIISSR